MSNRQLVQFEALRSLAEASISGTYAKVGGALAYPSRMLVITNNTDGDMFFSIDGTNNYIFVPKYSGRVYDWNTNRLNVDQMFVFAAGTQFWVKYSSAPSTGSVYIETVYGVPPSQLPENY